LIFSPLAELLMAKIHPKLDKTKKVTEELENNPKEQLLSLF